MTTRVTVIVNYSGSLRTRGFEKKYDSEKVKSTQIEFGSLFVRMNRSMTDYASLKQSEKLILSARENALKRYLKILKP